MRVNASKRVHFPGSLFAPISRQEAELIQQQAPPSYGQLIAQGIIPPVEDFPTENPNEVRGKEGPQDTKFFLFIYLIINSTIVSGWSY